MIANGSFWSTAAEIPTTGLSRAAECPLTGRHTISSHGAIRTFVSDNRNVCLGSDFSVHRNPRLCPPSGGCLQQLVTPGWVGCGLQGVRAERTDLWLDCLRRAMTSCFACLLSRRRSEGIKARRPLPDVRHSLGRMFVCSSATAPPPLPHRAVRKTCRSRSRTFLRSVLRFTPSSSAARIWLPRVAARAAPISGPSISRKIRW